MYDHFSDSVRRYCWWLLNFILCKQQSSVINDIGTAYLRILIFIFFFKRKNYCQQWVKKTNKIDDPRNHAMRKNGSRWARLWENSAEGKTKQEVKESKVCLPKAVVQKVSSLKTGVSCVADASASRLWLVRVVGGRFTAGIIVACMVAGVETTQYSIVGLLCLYCTYDYRWPSRVRTWEKPCNLEILI